MYRFAQTKFLRMLLITLLLFNGSAWSQESIVPPCARAKYDSEHEIVRTYKMLKLIFKTEQEIDLYARCYFEATGVDLGIEKARQKEKSRRMLGWLALILLVCYYVYDNFQIEFKSGGSDWDLA